MLVSLGLAVESLVLTSASLVLTPVSLGPAVAPVVPLATPTSTSSARDARGRDHDEQDASGRQQADYDEHEAGRPQQRTSCRRHAARRMQRHRAIDDDTQHLGLRPVVENTALTVYSQIPCSKLVRAKFHYTSWFGASSELAQNMFGANSEPASVMEFAANLLARASSLLAS